MRLLLRVSSWQLNAFILDVMTHPFCPQNLSCNNHRWFVTSVVHPLITMTKTGHIAFSRPHMHALCLLTPRSVKSALLVMVILSAPRLAWTSVLTLRKTTVVSPVVIRRNSLGSGSFRTHQSAPKSAVPVARILLTSSAFAVITIQDTSARRL